MFKHYVRLKFTHAAMVACNMYNIKHYNECNVHG